MRPYTFTWAEDANDTGLVGWVPDFNPTFNPNLRGIGVAHDVLEHFPGTDASPTSELWALGAMRWGRAEMGMLFNPWCSIEQGMGLSVGFLANGLFEQWEPVKSIKIRPIDDRHLTARIAETARIGMNAILTEAATWDYTEEEVRQLIDEERIVQHITRGYRMACRRYYRAGPSLMCDLFQRIADEVDAIEEPELGDRLSIRFCAQRCEAFVTITPQPRN